MDRILVAIDNEAASQKAVDWAIGRSQKTPAEIRVVSVKQDFWEAPPATNDVTTATRERIEATIPATRLGMAVATGPIVETLVASSRDADIIVLGSHRLQPVRSALTGSLPLRIAARSHCITVIVPEDWNDQTGSMVVGVGDDGTSAPALEWAVAEAARLDRPLDVVHAWGRSGMGTPGDDPTSDADGRGQRHAQVLTAAVERVHVLEPGVRIRAHLVHAYASEALADRARAAQLLVIGTHHHSPIVEWAVDGTAQAVVRVLSIPVAIVPISAPELDGVTS